MLQSLCIGISCGINQLLHVQFIIILRQANCMDNALAKRVVVDCFMSGCSLKCKSTMDLYGKLYIKKGENDGCRIEAVAVAIDGHFTDSKRLTSSKEQ
ncbi:hypothetical protein Gotur_034029 [Gossypium turneri]